jgi:protein gp37
VFCASLADVFDNEVPWEWRMDLFDLIRTTPNLDWLLLTKRIGNMPGMVEQAVRDANVYQRGAELFAWLRAWCGRAPPANVWLGATVVNQEEADRDIPKLLATPAAVRFLSMEPLLGPVALDCLRGAPDWPRDVLRGTSTSKDGQPVPGTGAVDWVIVGGESGPKARPMVLGWAKEIVRQCQAAGVPVMVKQLGAKPTNREGVPHPITDRKGGNMADWPEVLRVREFPNAA